MTYRKTTYSPQALKVAATQAPPSSQATAKIAAVKPAESAPAKQNVTSLSAAKAKDVNRWGSTPTQTSRQEIDTYLKNLTQLVEKDPKKAAEVFKGWLDKPSKIVKPKRAA
jgi:flagellar biosynthesis/type III secretory pathway M-ring protein FliF/YscJ